MTRRPVYLILALALACDGASDPETPGTSELLDSQLRSEIGQWGAAPIGPINQPSTAMVDLGKSLFFDKILSGNRDVSCASCHNVEAAVIDGLSLAVGTGGADTGSMRAPGAGRSFVARNAPSLLNAGLGTYSVLWDGRLQRGGTSTFMPPKGVVFPAGLTSLLAAQAMLPVLSRVEMRGNSGDTDVLGNPNELATAADSVVGVWDRVMQRLVNIQAYVSKFNAAYPGIPTVNLRFQHAANAIAAFEISSFTKHNSPFDNYLANDNNALTDDEKRGGIVFFGKGACASCHSGALMGGDQFANILVPQIGPGFGVAAPLDKGKGEAANTSFYDFAFRAPALRNVELTAPYMHNGAYPTLEAVVKHYTNPDSAVRNYDVTQLRADLRPSHHGEAATINAMVATADFRIKQGLPLTEEDRRVLVLFLKSLTDPAGRNMAGLIPVSVPSGLPIR